MDADPLTSECECHHEDTHREVVGGDMEKGREEKRGNAGGEKQRQTEKTQFSVLTQSLLSIRSLEG